VQIPEGSPGNFFDPTMIGGGFKTDCFEHSLSLQNSRISRRWLLYLELTDLLNTYIEWIYKRMKNGP